MTAPLPRTALVALLLSLAIVAVATAQPAASSPPPTARTPQLTADPAAVHAGATLTLTGVGFPRNVHVTLLAGPRNTEAARIGAASTERRGRFTATIRIRPHSSAGAFVALACHDDCRVKASTHFRIVAR
jgi:hypothetical protein